MARTKQSVKKRSKPHQKRALAGRKRRNKLKGIRKRAANRSRKNKRSSKR